LHKALTIYEYEKLAKEMTKMVDRFENKFD